MAMKNRKPGEIIINAIWRNAGCVINETGKNENVKLLAKLAAYRRRRQKKTKIKRRKAKSG
jgi:hypothetical protein